jgi:hypothetical protein
LLELVPDRFGASLHRLSFLESPCLTQKRRVVVQEYFVTNPNPELGFPKPSRKYNAVSLMLDKRWRDNWQVLGSYTWSRLKGNYEGYFRRENGQADPNFTSMFDFPYLEDPNIFQHLSDDGFLPNDRTHLFKLYGSYSFDFNLNLGLGVDVESGRPISRMGYLIPYFQTNDIPLDPRGSIGRTPTLANVGVHLDYAFNIGGRNRLELVFDAFNVFNQRDAIAVDTRYEIGGVVNPDSSLNVSPCSGCVNSDFNEAVEWQQPRRIRLALRSHF